MYTSIYMYVLKVHNKNIVTACLFIHWFVSVGVGVNICVGVVSAILQFSSYGSHFRCVTTWYIDVYSSKILANFIFYVETPIFEKKNTKAIVHGFYKIGVFQVGNEIELFLVRMYVYMSWMYTSKNIVTACLFLL